MATPTAARTVASETRPTPASAQIAYQAEVLLTDPTDVIDPHERFATKAFAPSPTAARSRSPRCNRAPPGRRRDCFRSRDRSGPAIAAPRNERPGCQSKARRVRGVGQAEPRLRSAAMPPTVFGHRSAAARHSLTPAFASSVWLLLVDRAIVTAFADGCELAAGGIVASSAADIDGGRS